MQRTENKLQFVGKKMPELKLWFAARIQHKRELNSTRPVKGIAVTVSLAGGGRPSAVTVSLRQVCAKYFRDSFLYY